MSAGTIPAIVNPGTTTDVIQKKNAFNRIPNSPRVMRLIGSVNNFKIGFIEILMSPNTNATNSAVTNVGTPIPGTRYDAANTANVSPIHFKMIFNIQEIN